MTYQTTAMLIAERDALILETRERALKAEAERDALRRVVAAADAMREHPSDAWRWATYDKTRAAIKEGK